MEKSVKSQVAKIVKEAMKGYSSNFGKIHISKVQLLKSGKLFYDFNIGLEIKTDEVFKEKLFKTIQEKLNVNCHFYYWDIDFKV